VESSGHIRSLSQQREESFFNCSEGVKRPRGGGKIACTGLLGRGGEGNRILLLLKSSGGCREEPVTSPNGEKGRRRKKEKEHLRKKKISCRWGGRRGGGSSEIKLQ